MIITAAKRNVWKASDPTAAHGFPCDFPPDSIRLSLKRQKSSPVPCSPEGRGSCFFPPAGDPAIREPVRNPAPKFERGSIQVAIARSSLFRQPRSACPEV